MVVLGSLLAVAEFEGDVLEALDLVESIRNRSDIAGSTFSHEIEAAYQALNQARYELDGWKVAATQEP